MDAYYRWLPDGPAMPSYNEEHARSKVQEAFPDAYFMRNDDPEMPQMHKLLVWDSLAAHQRADDPVAEIWWWID